MPTITTDPSNANKGTPRGREMLEHSLRSYGAGRSVLTDKHGVLIAGNKTAEMALELGLTERIIETDGTELIVVQRTDLDLATDRTARQLGIADNRVSEVGLEWDLDQLLADVNAGESFDGLFSSAELDALLANLPTEGEWDSAIGALPDGDKSPFEQMTFTVTADQAETIREALAAAKHDGGFADTGNENSNGNALARVCEAYRG